MNEKRELFEERPVESGSLAGGPNGTQPIDHCGLQYRGYFFIGQVGDPNQVAAVSLCMPLLEPVFTRGKGFGKIVAWKKKGEHRIPAA